MAVIAQAGALWFLAPIGEFSYVLAIMTSLVGAGMAFALSREQHLGLVIFAFMCTATSIFSGYGWQFSAAADSGLTVRGISANDLAPGPRAPVYAEFSDAKVYVRSSVRYTYTTKPSKGSATTIAWRFAPLAGRDWTPEKPVPAWVASRGGDIPREWSVDTPRATLWNIIDADTGALAAGVRNALQKGKLKGDPDAPVYHWGVTPGDLASWWFGLSTFIVALGVIPLFWAMWDGYYRLDKP